MGELSVLALLIVRGDHSIGVLHRRAALLLRQVFWQAIEIEVWNCCGLLLDWWL